MVCFAKPPPLVDEQKMLKVCQVTEPVSGWRRWSAAHLIVVETRKVPGRCPWIHLTVNDVYWSHPGPEMRSNTKHQTKHPHC